jgi:hypothetical protein
MGRSRACFLNKRRDVRIGGMGLPRPNPRELLALAGVAAWLGGCRGVLGIDDTEVSRAVDAGSMACGPDAAIAGSGWWSHCSPATGCYSLGVPTPAQHPIVPPGGSTADVPAFFLATRELHLGATNSHFVVDPEAWKYTGLDLDGLCTASPTCIVAGTTASTCKPSATVPVDGVYCLDNQVGLLDYRLDSNDGLKSVGAATDVEFNCGLCRGHYGFIFGIDGYNGRPNDDVVRVDIYPSPGIVNEPAVMDCSAWPEASGPVCAGSDAVWTIARDALVNPSASGPGLGRSRYYDPAAYVRDGVLVAKLPDNTVFWFPSGDRGSRPVLPFTLHDTVLLGRLVSENGAWRFLDGILAGRTYESDLLRSFRLIGVCNDHPGWLTVSSFITASADLLSTGAVAPEVPCDALSFGFSLRAEQAAVGGLVDVPALEECVVPNPDGG